MRIATRLVLVLTVAVTSIMVSYATLTQHQRENMLGEALMRETETLARTLQIVTNTALRDRRLVDLNHVLGQIVEDPETFVSVILDEQGRVLAGGADRDFMCLHRVLPQPLRVGEGLRGWVDCGAQVHWIALPARAPASAVVLGRRATVVEQDILASRRRHLVLTLVLGAATATVILLVLRGALSAPLAEMMRGVHALGGSAPPPTIQVPEGSGELGRLAAEFNRMVEQLEASRASLLREAAGRLELERRLGEAEKFAAMGRLTGGIAHELGSPLNVISARAEAVIEHPATSAPARRHAEEILHQVERVSELIRSFLHIARRHGIEREPMDMVQVVQSVAEKIDGQTRSAGVELYVRHPAPPVLVEGDGTLLRHALFNLALNAVQALADHTGDRRLWIRVENEREMTTVSVEDNGPGIAEEHLPHVSEPFFTTKDTGEGAGLGLAISRGIVEEHGGELQIGPREGGGVRAAISLPAHSSSAALQEIT